MDKNRFKKFSYSKDDKLLIVNKKEKTSNFKNNIGSKNK